MRIRSSPREKAFAIGTLVGFFGLLGVLFFDMLRDAWKVHLPAGLRTFLAVCLIVGFIVHNITFVMLRSERNRIIRTAEGRPQGVFWMRIVAVVLWLGVLPFACLWVYDQLYRPH